MLGSVRARARIPRSRRTDAVEPPPGTSAQRARAGGTRPRASGSCPDTASRWVSPVARSRPPGPRRPRVVPVHECRHQRPLGLGSARHRVADRRAGPPRRPTQASASAVTTGEAASAENGGEVRAVPGPEAARRLDPAAEGELEPVGCRRARAPAPRARRSPAAGDLPHVDPGHDDVVVGPVAAGRFATVPPPGTTVWS